MGSVVRPPSHPALNAFEIALKYANDVISGTKVAGKLVKLSAKRFLRDLKFGHERGLSFDIESAQHVVDFFGFLRHSKGEWGAGGGQVFVLSDWQVFILANLFGWKRADGSRRFREAYIEVGRKNGKTTFMAGIGLYLLVADDEPGAEIYSAATKKDQARIVFEEAARMRAKSEFLKKRVEVNGAKKPNNLNVLESFSKFEPLSSEDETLDGLNGHGILIDELHAHPDRKLYDVLQESIIARRQPLVLSITTAGYNRQGICFKTRERGEKILTGIVSAVDGDSFFAYIACMDEKGADGKPLDWTDPRNWEMANPNLGISCKLAALQEACNQAKQDPTKLNSFLRKHLCVWTSQDVRWMSPEKWAACNKAGALIDPTTLRKAQLERLAGRLCFAGLDLSSKIDLSAFVLIFPPRAKKVERRIKAQTPQEKWARKPVEFEEIVTQEEDPYWYVIPWFWVPKDNIQERVDKDRVEYDVWERQGFIETTPGNVVNQNAIRAKISELRSKFVIQEIGYDDWNASQLAVDLKQDGHSVTPVGQGFKSMSEPMKELMALVLCKKLEHLGNPVLGWCATNVAAQTDPADNIKPDKEHSTERIDGIVALIMALFCVIKKPSDGGQRSGRIQFI